MKEIKNRKAEKEEEPGALGADVTVNQTSIMNDKEPLNPGLQQSSLKH